MKGDCEDLNVLGKQIQKNNAETAVKSSSKNDDEKKTNIKISKDKNETNENNNNNNNNNNIIKNSLETHNLRSNLINRSKNSENPSNMYAANHNIDTNNGKKGYNTSVGIKQNCINENEIINTLVQNTEDFGAVVSQYDLNKFITNNHGVRFNENHDLQRKQINNNDNNFNYNKPNILELLKLHGPKDQKNKFEGTNYCENANKVNIISVINNHENSLQINNDNSNKFIQNSISERTKIQADHNTNLNIFNKSLEKANKKKIIEYKFSDPNIRNDPQNQINIHLPVDPGNDFNSFTKIFNNGKTTFPFRVEDLNAANTVVSVENANNINHCDDNYENLDDKDSLIAVCDEFGNDLYDIKAKHMNTIISANLDDKNPFVKSLNEFKNEKNNNNIKQLDIFKFDENQNNIEPRKKMKSNINLLQVNQKLSLNNNQLHCDLGSEHNLDIISNNQTPSLYRSISFKSVLDKTFNSYLSSDEGDEFYDAKRIDYEKNINNLNNFGNSKRNNKDHLSAKSRKNLRNKGAKLNSKSIGVNKIRRGCSTPPITLRNRNNLLEVISKNLVEKLNLESYKINLNDNNNLGKTPLPNETDKENIDISDRSIMEYLMKNHILDDSQGHFYNPTFLGYYINKQNLNDTNNKILLDSNNNNNNNFVKNEILKTSNSKNSIKARNFIKTKISIDNLKMLIRERNSNNNSINLKEILINSASQNNKIADGIIDISNNAIIKNSQKDYSIDISNNKEDKYYVNNINNIDLSGNENINNFSLSNTKKIEFGIDGNQISFDNKDVGINRAEDGKSKETGRSKLNSSRRGKKENNNMAADAAGNNNNKNFKREKNYYADPSKFISTKPQKNNMLNLDYLNTKDLETYRNQFNPNNETKNSKANISSIKKPNNPADKAAAPDEEKNKDINNNNNNLIKQSDEKRFLTNESRVTKNKNKDHHKKINEKSLIAKNTNINNGLSLTRHHPTKDLLKSSLEKGQKINLNQIMEFLENLILENEKNKKKTLMNLIDFKKGGGAEDANENIQFKVMNLGVLIEGDSISHCLDDDLKDLFWNIVKNSKSVVCCRCSPKQKAEVVGFVKKKSNEVTLAIGDGGNDIPMIKLANIGVGIFGKEGYQAAFNADYAISQFKYLKRLIFVHGRNSLLRNSYFIYFFFFKNVLLTLSQLWFCFFSGFSGQVFIYIFLTIIYNLVLILSYL